MADRRAGTALVRAHVEGAGPLAAEFDRAQRRLQDVVVRELRALGVRALAVVQASAERVLEEGTGELVAGMRVVPFFRASRPQVTIVSEATRDGYPYTAVTRFGHRQAIIRPKVANSLAVHDAKRETILARAAFVRGFGHAERRPIDWVDAAMPDVDREAAIAASRIGRAVDTDLLPGHRQR